jgi:hypothetical protein
LAKQPTNINESLLATTCAVLKRIEDIFPKHDLAIQSLEPLINGLAEELKEQQQGLKTQLEGMLERGFQQMEEKIGSLMREREELLSLFFQLHKDTVELVEASIETGVDQKIIERTTSMALVLEKHLLVRGVEKIIRVQDVIDKKGVKKRKVIAKDKDKD